MANLPWSHARSRAVLVGTGAYTYLPPVPAASNSLARMEALLTGDLCGWPRDRVRVFADERRPGDLPDQLVELYEDVRDVALFYFVGHGQVDPADSLCLGLVESRVEAPRRKTTSLPFDAIRYALSQSRAKAKIVILDCCYAGLAAAGTLAGADVLDLTRGTGAYTLAAAGEFDRAWFETDDNGRPQQTYFTKYFADVIECGIAGEPELLRLEPIFHEVAEELANDGKPVPTSRATGHAPRLEFARNAAAPTSSAPAAEEAPDAELADYLRLNAIPQSASAVTSPVGHDGTLTMPADLAGPPDTESKAAPPSLTAARGRTAPYPGLRREMGRFGLIGSSLGSIISTGFLFGSIYAAAAAGPAALLAWLIGGAAVLLVALTHAELAAMFPVGGGTVRFPRLAFGDLAGAAFGWFMWLQAVAVAPVEVLFFEAYANYWWPRFGSDPANGQLTATGYAVAVALMAAFTALNFLGIRLFARLTTLLAAVKVTVLVVAVVILLGSLHGRNFVVDGFMPYGFKGVLNALSSFVIFAFLGFEQADQFAGEARAPQRDIPLAVIGSVVAAMVIAVLEQLDFIGNLPGRQLAQGFASLNFSGGISSAGVAGVLGLGWLIVLFRGFALIALIGTGLIYAGVTTRLSYALARNRYAPIIFGRTDSRGVPWAGLALAFALSLLLFIPTPTASQVITYCVDASVLVYAGAPLALSSIRRQFPRSYRPFRMPFAAVLAPIAFIIANLIIYWNGWSTIWKLGVLMLIGYLLVGLTWCFSKQQRPPRLQWKSTLWLPAYLLGIGVISWQGTYQGTGHLGKGWDILAIAVFSLAIHYWAVASRLSVADASRILGAL
jgi:amino acid transporter